MVSNRERLTIHGVYLATCVALGPFLGVTAALWTLLQMVLVTEAMLWLAAGTNERSSDSRC